MEPVTPIFLAAASGPGLDTLIWVVAGVIWLFSQIAAAKKRQQRKERQAHQPPPAPTSHRSDADTAPTSDELSEIFKRLGADIPATPPPKPVHPSRTTGHTGTRRSAETRAVRPAIAQRLARVKKEAADAARQAKVDVVQRAEKALAPAVHRREDEIHTLNTATQHTGTILPRLHAMGLPLVPLPSLPMPGVNRIHHAGKPFPVHLHTRSDIRDAIIAQTFLSPSRSTSF